MAAAAAVLVAAAAAATDFVETGTITEKSKYKRMQSTFKIYRRKSPGIKFRMLFQPLDPLK